MRVKTGRRLSCAVLLLLVCISAALAKRDDDVVMLKNGDRLTGEIKGLSRGELEFKSSYMVDAVRLDWTKVERLESKGRYQILLIDGQLFTDQLSLTPGNAAGAENFLIGANGGARRVPQINVLRILPAETKFFKQLEGNVDLGLSYTSGNDQYQAELSTAATYRKNDHSFTASLDSVFSGQSRGTSTARNELNFLYEKQLSQKWFAGGLVDLLRSDQQSLDLRTTAGGIVGRHLQRTERSRVSAFAGLAVTRERYSPNLVQPRATNADVISGIDFSTFRFTRTDVTSRLVVYPSLTTPGRLRLQVKTDLRFKLFGELNWGFHLYENFDSKPPATAQKNDLGLSTGLGWTF